MVDITFYNAPGACSLAPHILLLETGCPFHLVSAIIDKSATIFPPGFADINPKQRVPVIVINSVVTTEVPAVSLAVTNLRPELNLMGANSVEKEQVLEWMCWISGTLHGQGFGHYFRPQRFSTDIRAGPGIKQRAEECIQDCFAKIEKRIIGLHCVGDHFTAVDAYLLVFYRWGTENGFQMNQNYPCFSSLIENLILRPTVCQAMMSEGITMPSDRSLASDKALQSSRT
jgi:glutathione S-transferase